MGSYPTVTLLIVGKMIFPINGDVLGEYIADTIHCSVVLEWRQPNEV